MYIYVYMYIYICRYVCVYVREIEMGNLSPLKHRILSIESSISPKLYIFTKLYEYCKSYSRNLVGTFERMSFE